MRLSDMDWSPASRDRRKFPRYAVRCCARIRIGNRQYAGHLHNISRAGAKLRTITPIRKAGEVMLRLPDLPPLRCSLRWTDSFNAGVSFLIPLSPAELSGWARTRIHLLSTQADELARLEERA